MDVRLGFGVRLQSLLRWAAGLLVFLIGPPSLSAPQPPSEDPLELLPADAPVLLEQPAPAAWPESTMAAALALCTRMTGMAT